jgi:hypothetical protein
MISLPQYYVESWGDRVLKQHNRKNYKWFTDIEYESPKQISTKRKTIFKGTLTLSFSKGRKQTSCYRLKWDNQMAVQLAKDYPKSFVRALEFHLGDEQYKKIKFNEFDIGGFKEQLQVKIDWSLGQPKVFIRELFRIREESQGFPHVFMELCTYLIADYLLADEKEILRRIQVGPWKDRKEIKKELKENNIYILLNRKEREIYFGETRLSLSSRYRDAKGSHALKEWDEYCAINLPPDTSDHTRLLIERILIAVGAKLFKNNLGFEPTDINNLLKLTNRKS